MSNKTIDFIEIDTPDSISVGEHKFLAKIENVNSDFFEIEKARKRIFSNEHIPPVRKSLIKISNLDGRYIATIICANKEYMEEYKHGANFEDKIKANYGLRSDSGKYEIIATYGEEKRAINVNFHSISDYGHATVHKNQYGFTVSFEFPKEISSKDNVEHILAEIFNFKK